MKTAIVGGGAAGCFAAANIPYCADNETIIFEKSARLLQKVRVSGGGRCNVTHQFSEISDFIKAYPRGRQLLKKTLHSFSPQDTIDWFEQRGVPLKTEYDGRVFPKSDSSESIIDCLQRAMQDNGTLIRTHCGLENIEIRDDGDAKTFLLHFSNKTTYVADRVLIATGGYQKAEQYRWLAALGHEIIPPVPSLFSFNVPQNTVTELMGVALPEVSVKIAGTNIASQGALLITHWGFSGPAVLVASSFAARYAAEEQYAFAIHINWLGVVSEQELTATLQQLREENGKHLLYSKNPFALPKRLWEYLLTKSEIASETRWADLSSARRHALIQILLRDTYQVRGKTTFKEEFVTCGGINIAETDPNTMQSRKVKGLFFAGEVLDADAVTGGYNFQHAWTSGWIAAKNMLL
jgi:predicted Rossmann fold flavoprotein